VDAAGGEAVNLPIYKRTETKDGPEILKVEESNKCNNAVVSLETSYPHRPSWKDYGQGRAVVELNFHRPSGTISLRVQEIPESYKGTKEVFVSLHKDAVKALAEILKEVQ
jgi:hypothetical protein